jgi:hypothetical protein
VGNGSDNVAMKIVMGLLPHAVMQQSHMPVSESSTVNLFINISYYRESHKPLRYRLGDSWSYRVT